MKRRYFISYMASQPRGFTVGNCCSTINRKLTPENIAKIQENISKETGLKDLKIISIKRIWRFPF